MTGTLRLGVFTLDAATRRLTAADGVARHLTPKAFDLLVLLAQEAPRVLAKEELHRHLWPDTFVSDSTLLGLIKEIRKVFREGGERDLLRTVHKVGYALDVVPAPVDADTSPGTHHWLVYGLHHFVLPEGPSLVGREPPAQVVINKKTVSRPHARITVRRAEVVIEDLASKNGTRVAGERLKAPRVLANGDHIEFGTETVTYRRAVDDDDTETKTAERSHDQSAASGKPSRK